MAQLLQYSMFQKVFFPPAVERPSASRAPESLRLQRLLRFIAEEDANLSNVPIVVFDFETTGLDSEQDRIVEVGAIKLRGFEMGERFEAFVRPDVEMGKVASSVSGITEEMLATAPPIDEVLPAFLNFIRGSILLAHNAEFDMAFLKVACARLGIELEWSCFCSLKVARALLPSLDSKGLDALAAHYGLMFEARHRSIGDVKVTCEVLKRIWQVEGKHLMTWKDVEPFKVA